MRFPGPATEPAPFLADDADVPELRKAVSEIAHAGYAEAIVRERLGLADLADIRWKASSIYREERLKERDPLAVAIDLFLLQGSARAEEVGRLLSAPARAAMLRTGFLSMDSAGLVRAGATLYPVGERLIFSDHAWHKLPHPGYKEVPSDQVMFVGTDSRWLARATVRRPVQRTLDLCTGSGIQALLAAQHSERVLAVDISPRAARCARCNARILGANNLEVVVGDVYDAVGAEERFDLILANPPFVPSPVDDLRFRDGGRSGEAVQQRIVAGLPRHLAAGGIAQMVTEVGERDGEPAIQRVRQWLGDAPMDIYMVRLRTFSAEDYAIGHGKGDGDYGAYLESVRAWACNLKAQGYVRIVAMLIAFQWSDLALGPSWDRVDESLPPRPGAGADVEAAFSSERGWRRNPTKVAPKNYRVRRAGPIALTESQVLGRPIRAATRAVLLGRALTVEHQLDWPETELLRGLDQALPLSELFRIAGELGIEEEAAAAAIDSLHRRGLICVTPS